MDNIKQFKKKEINNYVSNLDLNNINPNKIQEDLRRVLGEKPGVKLEYETHTIILEGTDKPKKVEKLKSVNIVYTVDLGDNKFLPIEETFILQ